MTVAGEYDSLLKRGPQLFGVPAIPLVALVMANLVPLYGVLLLGWDLRGVLLIYWAENVVIGIWAIIRMLVIGHVLAVPLILFFCVHFGMFMIVHLVFVYGLTSMTGPGGSLSGGAGPGAGGSLFPGAAVFSHVSWWALAALFISHGVSFARNFIAGGEWRKSSLSLEMGRPYPRMAIMHVAIIAGAWAIALLGQPAALLAVLVLLKIAVDAAAHIAEHRLAEARQPSTTPKRVAAGATG